jgi:hypothetical protein
MNERIDELMIEAGARFEFLHGVHYDDFQYKKFAELIVRECLDIMSKTSKEAEERFTYMGDDVPTVVHQMNIEKHFGVEE